MDAMLKAIFQSQVVPLMRAMPTDELEDIRAFVNEQVDAELATRVQNGTGEQRYAG